MVNPHAGEVALVLDGEAHVLKLTLGALAELEDRLEADSLPALVERFEAGRFAVRDVLALLCAGLRGGGWTGRPWTSHKPRSRAARCRRRGWRRGFCFCRSGHRDERARAPL